MTAGLLRYRLLRSSRWDGVLIALAGVHGAVLLQAPLLPVIAIGIWWNSNTIGHHFIHRPFFRAGWMNLAFSAYLTALLGIPQRLWRDRHLAHHRDEPWRLAWSGQLAVEAGMVAAVWAALIVVAPWFFVTVYAPAYAIGLVLCYLQGHYEHVRDQTISHYGRLYNLLFFNDGYHVEHHASPGTHWTRLPGEQQSAAPVSRWPAVLRWLDALGLEGLERIALATPFLQRFMVASHRRAFASLLEHVPEPRRIAIVGGGLFPRTALVLRDLLPDARLVVIDRSAANIETARARLGDEVSFVNEAFDAGGHADFDLVVIPLAFVGDRDALYADPPARAMLIHDWVWRPRGVGVRISWLLLKRLNLVVTR